MAKTLAVEHGVPMKKKKICVVITHSVSLVLYRGQLKPLSRRGFHITVVCDPRGGMQAEAERAGCRVVSMHMNRPMTPLADLVSFIRLILFFCRNRFDIVQVSTPKASLLGSLAARITGQPFILYAYWGIYYDTQTGWRKRLFRFLDHIVCTLADQVQGICEDLRSYVIRQFSTPARKTACLLGGPDGIDLTRWTSTDALKEQGSGIRRSMGIPEDDLVIGFCGRMVRNKGICELVEAFESLSSRHPVHLLLVGDYEAEDPVPDAVRQKIADNPLIHATGWVEDTVPYFAAMDIFTLPSYREGFGNTIIEAS
ncbi:MAG: glycosyltransferase, partial [Phycisphaerae bacterium]|nr:glycosyltransferase [Phycisphaerae bacterium]